MAIGLYRVAGQFVNVRDLAETTDRIVDTVRAGSSFVVYTLNLDHVVKLRHDARFREAYARAEIVSADGWPVVLCGRIQGVPVSRTTGADLLVPVCRAAAKAGITVFFIGSTPAMLERLTGELCALAPGLQVAGTAAPRRGFDPYSREADGLIGQIGDSGAGLVFVGLGAPKQELFAARARDRLQGVGLLCTGAAGDFIAGAQRRAPALWQKVGMEWLWRLVHNPKGLALRYARSLAILPGLLASAVVDAASSGLKGSRIP